MHNNPFYTMLLLLAALSVAGCTPATGLNTPCRLIKRNPDGGAPLTITEADVQAKVTEGSAGINKDVVSFGAVECEDLVCVRDAEFKPNRADAQENTMPVAADAPAYGYCSKACVPGSLCPSHDSSLDDGPHKLRCRSLILDAETLKNLADQGLSPGNTKDPYFCARGGTDTSQTE